MSTSPYRVTHGYGAVLSLEEGPMTLNHHYTGSSPTPTLKTQLVLNVQLFPSSGNLILALTDAISVQSKILSRFIPSIQFLHKQPHHRRARFRIRHAGTLLLVIRPQRRPLGSKGRMIWAKSLRKRGRPFLLILYSPLYFPLCRIQMLSPA